MNIQRSQSYYISAIKNRYKGLAIVFGTPKSAGGIGHKKLNGVFGVYRKVNHPAAHGGRPDIAEGNLYAAFLNHYALGGEAIQPVLCFGGLNDRLAKGRDGCQQVKSGNRYQQCRLAMTKKTAVHAIIFYGYPGTKVGDWGNDKGPKAMKIFFSKKSRV
jgi:hypothetical protein